MSKYSDFLSPLSRLATYDTLLKCTILCELKYIPNYNPKNIII